MNLLPLHVWLAGKPQLTIQFEYDPVELELTVSDDFPLTDEAARALVHFVDSLGLGPNTGALVFAHGACYDSKGHHYEIPAVLDPLRVSGNIRITHVI